MFYKNAKRTHRTDSAAVQYKERGGFTTMKTWAVVLLVILAILIVAVVVLYFLGRKMQKKQEEQQQQIEAYKQNVTMLVIDKKIMKLKEAGLPQSVIDNTPKMMRRSKLPIVKAKVGPQIVTLVCDQKIFDLVPVKKEVKATVSGIYLTNVKAVRGTLVQPENQKKKNWFKRNIEKLQEKADRKVPVPAETVSENRTRLLLSFFEGETSLSSFTGQNAGTDLRFMQEPCAVCYVTFEKFLSNEAFSISGKLLCDMILDAVQGVLQPYILVLNDYSALVVFSQKELDAGQMKVDQLVKKLYNRFTMYQSFAPDMPYQENLPDYEEARNIYQTFTINEGHYTDDIAKTLAYIEGNYMHRLTLSSISANVSLSSSYLCRVFKSEVGTSITSYLNNLRIRKAATMIKDNRLSLKEISTMVGIDDQLYFSRLFKKCMGISPSEYGKRFHQ